MAVPPAGEATDWILILEWPRKYPEAINVSFSSFLADMANRVSSLPFKSYNALKTSLITQAKSVARAYTSSPGGRGQCTN